MTSPLPRSSERRIAGSHVLSLSVEGSRLEDQLVKRDTWLPSKPGCRTKDRHFFIRFGLEIERSVDLGPVDVDDFRGATKERVNAVGELENRRAVLRISKVVNPVVRNDRRIEV